MRTKKRRRKRGGVEFRADRGKWGYRLYFQGHNYKRFVWGIREEAKAARNEKKRELASSRKEPELPPTALVVAINDYLADSAEIGRSEDRVDALRWNFQKVLLKFFGEATPIGSITHGQIRKMLLERKRAGWKPKTLLHDVTNVNALLNWGCKPRTIEDGETPDGQKRHREIPPLISKNPLDIKDLRRLIGSTKSKKPPLDMSAVERAAAVLDDPEERAYFDFLRFTGLRRDEANRLRWTEINFERGEFHCTGTKTAKADDYLPLAEALIECLRDLKARSTSEFVFPGKSAQTKGKRIRSRRRMFEKIERATSTCNDCGKGIARRRYCRDCKRIEMISRVHRCSKCKSTNVSEGTCCVACGSTNIKPGVKLKPKDMRDVFASTVETGDPRVLMELMRHTNLTTTTSYLKAVKERMRDAVKNLGKTSSETSQKNLGANLGANENALADQKRVEKRAIELLAKLLKNPNSAENLLEKIGGGGRSRTYDAADMSRVL
jgi:integrase